MITLFLISPIITSYCFSKIFNETIRYIKNIAFNATSPSIFSPFIMIILRFFHNLINLHDILHFFSKFLRYFFPSSLEKLLGQDWTRCKCVLSICALHEWRNANAMSRVTHLGWSKSGTSCAFVALVANISLFFLPPTNHLPSMWNCSRWNSSRSVARGSCSRER